MMKVPTLFLHFCIGTIAVLLLFSYCIPRIQVHAFSSCCPLFTARSKLLTTRGSIIGFGFNALAATTSSTSADNNADDVATSDSTVATTTDNNNILILDHLNINHEKGRHDLVKAFYVDVLKCSIDPRKLENVEAGKKTIWMNIGCQQFHLPEGKPTAQVLDGIVTLVYPNLESIIERYEKIVKDKSSSFLLQSKLDFKIVDTSDGKRELMITDPWGTKFRIVEADKNSDGDYYGCRDPRGKQPGDVSEGYSMCDLTIYTPPDSNLDGIGRFYEQVLGAQLIKTDELHHDKIQILTGPYQTLTFQYTPTKASSTTTTTTVDSHVDLRDESSTEADERAKQYTSNYGPHISMYVSNLKETYVRCEQLGVCYVNPRFKRRAYTLDEAFKDCMFRCLDIIDPQNPDEGPILKLEHEIRSCIKQDGSKYKSCPFDEIPKECQ